MISYPTQTLRDTPTSQIQTGDGYSIWPRSPGGPLLNLTKWTPAVERLLSDGLYSRVSIEPEWTDATIDALLPFASSLAELHLKSSALTDMRSLAQFPVLRKLMVTAGSELVPFTQLYALTECSLVRDSMGAVHEAPSLETLIVYLMKRVSLANLASLSSLRQLSLTGTFSALTLDGIEALPLERVTLRQVPRLDSVRALASMPLQYLRIEDAGKASDVEMLAGLHSLEELHLEKVGAPRSLEFLAHMTKLRKLSLCEIAVTDPAPSIAPVLSSTQLRELLLIGNKGRFRTLRDVERLGELALLEVIRLRDGPKEIASLDWVGTLERLRVFEMQGTRILDGSLAPLLKLKALNNVLINPAPKAYSHTNASFHAAMQARTDVVA